MNILERIAADKLREVALKKQVAPERELRQHALFTRPTHSLKDSLERRPYGIIAEHKRRSPSRAVINQGIALEDVVSGYSAAGAGGISVLTDGLYFGGSLEDLQMARAATDLPLLRKEFILDTYQITEARAFGADAVLLIAAMLDPGHLADLAQAAQAQDLEVLVEVHDRAELEAIRDCGADLFGVNNRNLKTFEVDLDTSRSLAGAIPDGALKVSESGLGRPEEIRELHQLGYRGFLMGESFMKTADPGTALDELIKSLQS